MFSDEKQSGVVLVTLPEEMPVTETFELYDALNRELRLPVAQVIVNGVIPPVFSPAERSELMSLRRLGVSGVGRAALAAGARRAQRELVQHEALLELREMPVPLAYLPFRFGGVNTLEGVSELAMRLT
jgi:anion-transporting  ArsA/GET3 family ATPase